MPADTTGSGFSSALSSGQLSPGIAPALPFGRLSGLQARVELIYSTKSWTWISNQRLFFYGLLNQVFFFWILSIVAGCSPTTLELSAELLATTKTINAQAVVVSDLTSAPHNDTFGHIYKNTYVAIEDKLTNPPFRTLISGALKKTITASNDGKLPILTISIVEAAILQEVRVADSVVYIGILSALAPRNFECVIDANFQFGIKSDRKQFRHMEQLPLSWLDNKPDVRTLFVENCSRTLVKQVHEYSAIITGTLTN